MSRSKDDEATSSEGADMAVLEFRQMFGEGRSFSGHERNCAFLNTTAGGNGAGSFADISSVSGFDFPDDGRAVARVDWDHDGDLDLWVANRNAPQLRFLRNDSPAGNHFLTLRLVGNGTSVPRDAIGSQVTLTPAGHDHPLTAAVRAGEGFLSQSSKWIHLGLGKSTNPGEVTVRWSDGTSESFDNLTADHRYRLVQGSGQAMEVPTNRGPLKITPTEQPPISAAPMARVACMAQLKVPSLLYLQRPRAGQQFIEVGQGQPVLINLWSSSCLPCLKELNEFRQRHNDLTGGGVRVVALSVDAIRADQDEIDSAQEFLKHSEFPFLTGYADWKLIFLLQGLHNSLVASDRLLPVPSSFLVDEQGRLTAIYKGPVGVDQILADLELSDIPIEQRFDRLFPFGGHRIDHPQVAKVIADGESNTIFRFAQELEASQRVGSSIAQYRDLLKRVPNHVVANFSVGNLLIQDNEFEEGIASFEKVISLDPSFGPAHYRLGVVHLMQNRTKQAVTSLEKAVELLPDEVAVRRVLATAYEKAGRVPDAIRELEAILAIKPGDRQAEQWLRRLRPRS